MNSYKILLALLPIFTPSLPPINLGFLQAYLNKHNIHADILDYNNYFYNLSDVKLKKDWRVSCNIILEENILSIIKKRFIDHYESMIRDFLKYDVIGFSCFKSNFKTTIELVKNIKSLNKNLKVIFGGPEITRQYFKTTGKFNNDILAIADYIVVGEGEKPILDIIRNKAAEKVMLFDQLEDIKNIPFPKYHGLVLHNYPKHESIPILLSRGCVRGCNFCSERLLFKGYRSRDINNIVDEIRYHKENSGVNNFVFFDSLLNADLSELEELCDSIIQNFGSINWEAQMIIRKDMDINLFKKIKQSGCYNLFIGLESGSDATLKKMKKGFTISDAVSFFEKLNEAKLFFGVSMIVGYPDETENEFKESLNFIIQNKSLIPKIEQVNPFTYYDGTNTDKGSDYKYNKTALERMEIFISEIKKHKFKYTNAFLGNLIEKNDRI